MSQVDFLTELPVPPHFDPAKVTEVWKVPYQQRALQAQKWAQDNGIKPAAYDQFRLALIAIDIQNTFCLPDFELYVGGRSGNGAVDDNRRLAAFIYRNLAHLTEISVTMDTHQAMQIFHSIYLVNERGEHPASLSLISASQVEHGEWKFNPEIAPGLGISPEYGQAELLHYVQRLKQEGKYDLTIWPYHAMLGGIGHALVSSIEEAVFFHTISRHSQVDIGIKGDNPLSESYSAIGPEVLDGPDGRPIGRRNPKFFQKLLDFDAVIICGQAKSHCVAWTVADLLEDILAHDASLARKVYLLDDCCSPVVVPGIIDYTDAAEAAFEKFAAAGMHRVLSTEPLHTWLQSDQRVAS